MIRSKHAQASGRGRISALVGVLVLVLVLVVFAPAPAFAQAERCIVGSTGLTPSAQCITDATKATFFRSAACYCCGSCGFNDFVGVAIQVSRFIFGIAGSLALLMMMIGGFWWLTAAGSPDRVKKGTETLTHAAIGLVIVFGAWIFVNFLLIAITGNTPNDKGIANLMSGNWYQVE